MYIYCGTSCLIVIHSESKRSEAALDGEPSHGVLEADIPFIARKHRTKERYIGLLWNAAATGAANPRHPCMHINPVLPVCPAGTSVKIEGMVLFHDGDMESLVAKAKQVCDGHK